jgi:hypothetical protein
VHFFLVNNNGLLNAIAFGLVVLGAVVIAVAVLVVVDDDDDTPPGETKAEAVGKQPQTDAAVTRKIVALWNLIVMMAAAAAAATALILIGRRKPNNFHYFGMDDCGLQ